MDPQEAFDIEYWSLEEAKLRRLPPEKELDRQIVVVVGAGAGIGKATAHRLVQGRGAHGLRGSWTSLTAKATAQEIVAKYGEGIGVAGSGISNCGPAIGLGLRHHEPRERRADARRMCCSPMAASTPWS